MKPDPPFLSSQSLSLQEDSTIRPAFQFCLHNTYSSPIQSVNPISSVLISYCNYNKVPQTQWSKTPQIYYLTVPQVRSPAWISVLKSKHQQSCVPLWMLQRSVPLPRSHPYSLSHALSCIFKSSHIMALLLFFHSHNTLWPQSRKVLHFKDTFWLN